MYRHLGCNETFSQLRALPPVAFEPLALSIKPSPLLMCWDRVHLHFFPMFLSLFFFAWEFLFLCWPLKLNSASFFEIYIYLCVDRLITYLHSPREKSSSVVLHGQQCRQPAEQVICFISQQILIFLTRFCYTRWQHAEDCESLEGWRWAIKVLQGKVCYSNILFL